MDLYKFRSINQFKEPWVVTTDSLNLDLRNATIARVELDKNRLIVHLRGLGTFHEWRAKIVNNETNPKRNRLILTQIVDKSQLPRIADLMAKRYLCVVDAKPYDKNKIEACRKAALAAQGK